ncbi:MAG: serine/threonine-protein kinase [Candidatus Dormiibacterota bacterium]
MKAVTERLQPGEYLDSYRIVDRLGAGAFSEVYRAVDEGGRDVVLKCPHEIVLGDSGAWDRFRREMKITEHLDHPGIQRSLDPHRNRSRLYMALVYVDGVSLRQVMHNEGRMSPARAVDLVRQITEAMVYAHGHHVFHRDLKPDNVLVTPDGRTVVTDFGIALMEGAKRLTFRFLTAEMGTPDYMAPEQVQGKRGDARTDVYAIGVMLYEMVAGKVPWRGKDSFATMSQKLIGPPADLHAAAPRVPMGLVGIVHKAVRRDPEERYQTTAELLADLDRWESIDPATYVFADEKKLKASSQAGLMILVASISVGFLLLTVGAAVAYHFLVVAPKG